MTLREFIDKKQRGRTINVECWYKYVIQQQIAWSLGFTNNANWKESSPQKCENAIEDCWQKLLATDVNEAFEEIGFNKVENDDLS